MVADRFSLPFRHVIPGGFTSRSRIVVAVVLRALESGVILSELSAVVSVCVSRPVDQPP
jgi:hypothetical protein